MFQTCALSNLQWGAVKHYELLFYPIYLNVFILLVTTDHITNTIQRIVHPKYDSM